MSSISVPDPIIPFVYCDIYPLLQLSHVRYVSYSVVLALSELKYSSLQMGPSWFVSIHHRF